MKKTCKKSIALSLIILVITIPFYASGVFAQQIIGQTQVPVANPVQSCIEKHQDNQDFIDFMDSGPIKTLEKIVSTLWFTCSAWSATEAALDVPMVAIGFIDESAIPPVEGAACISAFTSPTGSAIIPLCRFNAVTRKVRDALNKVFVPMCSLTTCALCEDSAKAGALSPANLIPDISIGSSTVQKTMSDAINFAHLSPFDNIYVAIGCLCPVGVLFNLRKLKTIYQTYNCCIEQACTNGISTETCDRQLSQATCMYWEGSILTSLIKIIMSFVAKFIAEEIISDSIKSLASQSNMFKTLWAMFKAYNSIQSLQSKFKWVSQSFSEPACNDLGFDKINERRKQELTTRLCDLMQIDIDHDGIFDRVETRCS